MKYNLLPNTTIKVSTICLGTMTFGQQNTEKEAHQQLDFAIDKGINFLDTAEMYAVPTNQTTYGLTEKYIGSWLQNGNRDKMVVATKIAGPNRGLEYIRKDLRYTQNTLIDAVHQSLERLQTDYIDLYQLHWPERPTNMFGQRGFEVSETAWEDHSHTVLSTFEQLIKEGKIRAIGLSNETPWGLMHFLQLSKEHQLPRVTTIQNPYSLLNRLFEVGLAEMCYREKVGLLPYSPLGFGTLTGKYLNNTPSNARISLFPKYKRYSNDNAQKATKAYAELAHSFGISLTEMALAFVQQQPYVTSTIIGATNLAQLEENTNAFSVVLSKEIIGEINKIQELYPNPAP